ncbi:N-6 DNA methylase [Sinorhizobium medicae]|uniref:Eco57I restriction-modification methylase domain-containing protein n=1 Tax=Sinorhizobium medicae TaxID=110321 RepID=UPI000FD7C1BD|nr:TaqI-like C-terminal specificity domain-containing protein [Sinorhizobium medicae]MDX0432516.1 N-6 DNA methylase [Sinorhizobium medicae]MDX0722680.1 N-6 DNA methylase [Sinorhizobium medicae]MDX0992214.1 N-6 DNA methylase [Sinorhizobium medicae]MDX1078461.1 N-6 DNA methylase [Sinorhizobium medicae]RVJ04392.1 hypothetical protein CN181_23145 [Sinorhizobium medicae]
MNAESVEIAKLSLWVKTARRGKMLDSLDNNLKVGDSLIEDSNFAYLEHGFSWRTAFPQVFRDGGFDIVLGNPPYVRMELLKAMKPYLEDRFEVVSDRADLYAYFFERGLKLLKPGGRLGYISSATFFKTGSGAPLRRFLRRKATIEHVVDFGDLQIFDGVTTYPAVLVMRSAEPKADHSLSFWRLDSLPDSSFTASYATQASRYAQAALTDGSWELESATLKALRDKIRNSRPTLKEVYGAPLYGIKTGLNEAFVIDTRTKERLCSEDPKSAELLRPFLEGKDLKRWRQESRGRWIIYIPKNRIRIDDYPAIRDWLLPFKDRLERRATKQEWFALQQAQEAYAPFFQKTKITYRDIAAESPFHLDDSGSYLETTAFAIPSDDFALAAILNSKVLWFIFKTLTPLASGGYFRMKAQYVGQLPVPECTPSARLTLADFARDAQQKAQTRLKLQTGFTRRIPDLCPPGRTPTLSNKLTEWWTLEDFAMFRSEVKKAFKSDIPLADRSDWEDWFKRDKEKIGRLTADIAAQERNIDAIIYSLFKLTSEEIHLLETVT